MIRQDMAGRPIHIGSGRKSLQTISVPSLGPDSVAVHNVDWMQETPPPRRLSTTPSPHRDSCSHPEADLACHKPVTDRRFVPCCV
jgi:hypothetical protein